MASARLHLARPCTGAVNTVTRRGSVPSAPMPPPPDFPRSRQRPRRNPTNPVRRAEYSPWPVSPDTGTVRPLQAMSWAVCALARSFYPPLTGVCILF